VPDLSLAMAYFRAGELEKARSEYERITVLTTGRAAELRPAASPFSGSLNRAALAAQRNETSKVSVASLVTGGRTASCVGFPRVDETTE